MLNITDTARTASSNLAIAVQWPCECPTILQSLYDFFLPPCSPKNRTFAAQSVRGLRSMSVRGLYNATYDMYMGYGLTIFSNLFNFSRNKIVKAAEPVNTYENLTAASCLRTEAARKRVYGQDTGSAD